MKMQSDVALIPLPRIDGGGSSLIPIERATGLPFDIQRIFCVTAQQAVRRGSHAHRECNQFLICLSGACKVICDDGVTKETYILDKEDQGLFIPASVWAEQEYLEPGTILMAVCDQPYDEADYLHDYDAFLEWRMGGVK